MTLVPCSVCQRSAVLCSCHPALTYIASSTCRFLLCLCRPRNISPVHATLRDLVDPRLFIGRAAEQVDDFMEEVVDPILENSAAELLAVKVEEMNV